MKHHLLTAPLLSIHTLLRRVQLRLHAFLMEQLRLRTLRSEHLRLRAWVRVHVRQMRLPLLGQHVGVRTVGREQLHLHTFLREHLQIRALRLRSES
jgi:hypothetical protein